MDPETAALIAQLQLEDQEERAREDERRRQLQADEELARKEQQSEAQEWQSMQHEQEQRARLQRDQIARDESRAVSLFSIYGLGILLTCSARLPQRKDGSIKKGHSGVKVHIVDPTRIQMTAEGPTIEQRNSQMIDVIAENSGLPQVVWLVGTTVISTTGPGIRVRTSTLVLIRCFNPVERIIHHLPIIPPRCRRLLIAISRRVGSIGGIAILYILETETETSRMYKGEGVPLRIYLVDRNRGVYIPMLMDPTRVRGPSRVYDPTPPSL